MSLGESVVADPTDPTVGPSDDPENPILAWLLRVVSAIPDQLAIVLLCAAVTVTVLLQVKLYNPFAAILITAGLVAVTWVVRPLRLPRYAGGRHSGVGALVAIELVGAWIWVNVPYYEQMLSVYRDPSIYALRGWWLTRHRSPLIDVSAAVQGAHGVPGATAAAGGFPVYGTHYAPQGASLVPGLIAVAGRLGGLRAMLAANLVIGGVALLVVYALARRLMGPLWALIPMVGLALSMPMVYFSRASYTEPAALAAVVGGLVLLVIALGSGRRLTYGLAGLLVGVSALARVDGILAVTGAMLGVGIAAIGALDSARRRELRAGMVAFAIGGAITSGLGWYDLKYNSPSYYASQVGDLHRLVVLLVVSFVVLLGLSYLPIDRFRAGLSNRRVGLARCAAGFVLVGCAVMASRPLWWTGRFNTSVIGQLALAQRQKAAGLPIDPTRSYDEHTVTWLAWYLTWPVVVLAAGGLAVLLYRVARRRDVVALVVFATFGVVSALYLNNVNITPDQIWASRRFLPVTIPLAVLAAAVATKALADRSGWRWLAVPLAVLVALGPALQWRYVFMQAEFGGELHAVDAACATVAAAAGPGPTSYVILAGPTPATGSWGPTLTVMCHADVVSLPAPTPARIAAIRGNWGQAPVAVVTFDPSSVSWAAGAAPAPSFSGEVIVWNQSLVARPAGTTPIGVTFWVGTAQSGGQVAALPR